MPVGMQFLRQSPVGQLHVLCRSVCGSNGSVMRLKAVSPIWTTRRSRTASPAVNRSAIRRRPKPSGRQPQSKASGSRPSHRPWSGSSLQSPVSGFRSTAAATAGTIFERSPSASRSRTARSVSSDRRAIYLHALAAASGTRPAAITVRSSVPKWRPVRDSNPCYQRERLPMSLSGLPRTIGKPYEIPAIVPSLSPCFPHRVCRMVPYEARLPRWDVCHGRHGTNG